MNNHADGSIYNITGNFITKIIVLELIKARGGGIHNAGTIGQKDDDGNLIGEGIINSKFQENYAKSESGTATGGAIFNSGSIGEIKNSTFTGNYATSESGLALGGAISNTGTIGNITGDFINNSALGMDARGGAVYNFADKTTSKIEVITGDFCTGNLCRNI